MCIKKDFGLCFQSLLRFMDVVLQKISVMIFVFINNDKQIFLMINKFFQNLKGVISYIFFKT